MRSDRRRRAGFTLVEMTVATVLLFVGVVAAIVCITSAVRSQSMAAQRANAAMLAERRMAQLEATPDEIGPGEQQGEFGEEYPGYAYTQSVEATEWQDLYHVTVTVTWPGAGARRSLVFDTFLSAAQPDTTSASAAGTAS
ncbi:MAG: prepilin-type N-terminal cleavage/methylation domain-containing protein [Armatimonadetes bacterium]|nr:prepilin-type N-terminal cleavage/methylation domain-containing protein [Armatimonadota bacterium]